MIAPSSAGRSTDTARTAWKPALQSGPAGSRLWARLLAGAMLLPDRVHPRRKVAGVNALGCARAKAGGVTLTGFKPPYWGRSRTHLRNGCNRFPPCRGLPPLRPTFPPLRAAPFLPLCFPPLRGLAFPPAPLPPLAPDLPFPLLPRPPQAPFARRCRAATFPPLRGLSPFTRGAAAPLR